MGIRSLTDAMGIDRAAQDRRPERLSRLLGWFSLGVGITTLAATRRVSRLCGVDDSPTAHTVLRAVGVRELGTAVALLGPRRAAPRAWTRVLGDAMDLAAAGRGLRNRRGERRRRLTYTLTALTAVTAVDLYAAARATRGRRLSAGRRAHGAITVNRSPEETYRFWRDLENLPRFMYHLKSVREIGAGRSRWTAKAPVHRRVRWEAQIVEDRPNELISWRSVEGTKVPNCGTVRFAPAGGGRGTEIRVELEYVAPGRALGALVAKAFGENPQQQVCDDLRRFKQVIETGEITRSDSTPDGISIQTQAKQRAARPLAASRKA